VEVAVVVEVEAAVAAVQAPQVEAAEAAAQRVAVEVAEGVAPQAVVEVEAVQREAAEAAEGWREGHGQATRT
jgi:hypothetical protein